MKLHKYVLACETFVFGEGDVFWKQVSPTCSRNFSAVCSRGEESNGVATQGKMQLFVQYKSLPGVHTIIDGYSN